MGKKTVKILQFYLRWKGHYSRAIDSSFGPQTWKGVQRLLVAHSRYHRAIDGRPGNYTWDALATFVAYDFSGINYMPQWNAGRLYRHWHPELVKGLQHGLNINYR